MDQIDDVRPLASRTKTQTMTGIGLFVAIALILNLSRLQVPAPYAPFLIYEIWEIPIVACLLIYGLGASIIASLINTGVLLLVNPGSLGAGPIYNLIAVIVTLISISAGNKLLSRMHAGSAPIVVATTALAAALRALVLTFVNFVLLPFPPPLGFSIPLTGVTGVIAILPLIAFFNATIVLYTVPFGYAVVRAVSSRFRFRLAYPLTSSSLSK
ncbi:MAG: hypothetical protein OK439_02270 [Thaumarchaeota archaeon]|nr:hypothetical protein [Nitrososphaerota archaeon]